MNFAFPKSEKIVSNEEILSLLSKSRSLNEAPLRVLFRKGEQEVSRMAVSVPKRSFKRAVIRNKLKRRIRESYRLNRALLGDSVWDLLIIYTSKDIESYQVIDDKIKEIFKKMSGYSR